MMKRFGNRNEQDGFVGAGFNRKNCADGNNAGPGIQDLAQYQLFVCRWQKHVTCAYRISYSNPDFLTNFFFFSFLFIYFYTSAKVALLLIKI